MAQWDVYRNPVSRSRSEIPFLLQVQHDHLNKAPSRVVIPLARCRVTSSQPRLFPQFEIEGTRVELATLEIAAVPSDRLQTIVTNLESERHTIIAAIDYMIGAV